MDGEGRMRMGKDGCGWGMKDMDGRGRMDEVEEGWVWMEKEGCRWGRKDVDG